jgi:hypothetical protein
MATSESNKADKSSGLILHYKLEFKQSKEKAFAYLREISRRKEFMTIVDETIITKKTKGRDLTGTRFKERTHFLGFDMNLEYEIAEYAENKIIATKCEDGPFFPFMKVELLKGDESTCNAEVTVKLKLGALRLMPKFIIKPTIEVIVKRILKKLVARIEAL